MSKILLTGATGFVGSHLTKELVKRDHEVHALVRHSPRASPLPEGVEAITGDLLDIFSLKKAMRTVQPEVVCHIAALTPVRYSFDNPFIYAQTNYVGTMNMVHAALKQPTMERFIHASTAEVYEPRHRPMKEEDKLFGSTPYGVSKVAADHYVQVAGDCYGLPYTILRPSNSYGRKRERGYIVEKIITTMLTSDELVLNGSPYIIRDYMHISDHVNGYLRAIESKKGGIFNISTGKETGVGDLVAIAKSVTDFRGEVRFMGKPRPHDPVYLVLDNAKARAELGWEPKVGLKEGLKLVADFWRSRL